MVKSIALLLPVYVTLMWALVLFFQKKSSGKANKVLALFMAVAFLLYCCHSIFFHQLYHLYSFVDSIYLFALLSMYPLFYAYVLFLSGQKSITPRFGLNFIPAIFISVVSLVLNLLLTPDQRIHYVRELLVARNFEEVNFFSLIGIKGFLSVLARVAFIFHAIVYLLLGIRVANKHNAIIPNFYSNTEGRNLNWVRNISFFIMVASVSGITLAILGRGYFASREISLLIPSVIFSSIYFLIGFYGNQQVMITDVLEEPVAADNGEPDNSHLLQTEKLKKKLLQLFEIELIYKHPDLRITTIAEVIGTNRTYISRLINDDFGMNFNEFVNKYRVEEAERLLACSDHFNYTLEYIAEKSGFGNTNSFTRSFKEFNGLTPGQFRLNCQKEFEQQKI